MNLNTAKATLTVVSQTLSPDEISRYAGIRYDNAHRIGDRKGKSDRTWDENVWWLSESSESHDTERALDVALHQCIQRLRKRIAPIKANIRALSNSAKVEFGLYMLAQSVPPIHLNPDTVSFIHELGAELDIDVVLYSEE